MLNSFYFIELSQTLMLTPTSAAIISPSVHHFQQAVYHRACIYFMGLGKYAPNIAVQGDMGLHLSCHHQWMCVTRQWFWMINMTKVFMNKKAFVWTCKLDKLNWCGRVTKMYSSLGINHLCLIDQTVSQSAVLSHINVVLKKHLEQEWNQKLQRVEAVRGQRRNKLQTYQTFKHAFSTEPYLPTVLNKKLYSIKKKK